MVLGENLVMSNFFFLVMAKECREIEIGMVIERIQIKLNLIIVVGGLCDLKSAVICGSKRKLSVI